jgi:type II secretory pathway pseudopilin PulG
MNPDPPEIIIRLSPHSSRPSRLRGSSPGFAEQAFDPEKAVYREGAKDAKKTIQHRHRSGGFTFVEVLFAVILLGIGFIMIAGVFPVSIQQTATTIDETTGNTVARGAIDQIQEAINSGMPMPVTVPITGGANTPAVWPLMLATPGSRLGLTQLSYLGSASFFYPNSNGFAPRWSNSINTQDTRFSWVAFYNRQNQPNGQPAPYSQVIVIALKNSYFISYPTAPPVPGAGVNITNWTGQDNPPTPQDAQLAIDTTGTPTIAFTNPIGNDAPGAFAIVEENPNPVPPNDFTPSAGRIYRLGAQINTHTYQIQPGTDPQQYEYPNATHTAPVFVRVYLVGRAPTPGNNYGNNPTNFSTTFTGPNQDIAAVSGFVRINQ